MVAEVTRIATDSNLDIKTVQQQAALAQQTCLTSELAVLTPGQRRDFNELMGKPFDLALLRRSDGNRPPSLTFIYGLEGRNSYVLLGDHAVQRELRLSAEQSMKVDKIVKEADADLTTIRLDILKHTARDFSELDLAEKRRTVRAILDRAAAVHQKTSLQVRQILTDEQSAKLDAKLIQLIGARALDSESVASRLRLSKEQKSALAALNARFIQAMAPLVVVRQQSDFDHATYDKNLEKLEGAARAILTVEQKQMLDKMAQNTEKVSPAK
jgi:hypothetical protein